MNSDYNYYSSECSEIIVGDYTYYDDKNGADQFSGKERLDDDLIQYLEQIQLWNWDDEKIFNNLEILCSNDLQRIKEINL